LSRGFDPASCPAQPLGSYHANRYLHGWILPPQVICAALRRTLQKLKSAGDRFLAPETTRAGQSVAVNRGRPREQGRNRCVHLFDPPGYWARHAGKVICAIGRPGAGGGRASNILYRRVVTLGVGEGRMTVETG
jgi:hypothetical protein